MLKRTLYSIALLTILVAVSLVLLFHFASLPNERPNNFSRNWLQIALLTKKVKKNNAPLDKIVGFSKEHYFFSVPNPQWLIMVDTNLNFVDTLGFGLPLNESTLEVHNTVVDSPDVYFFSNNIPALYKGQFLGRRLDTIQLATNVFTRSGLLLPGAIILRTLDSTLKKQVFQKLDIHSGEVVAEQEVIPRQVSAGFESDGWLKYDFSTHHIYYIEYYRNSFYCLDTNLNTIYTGNTIDTVRNGNIEIKLTEIEGKNHLMPASSRVRVNNDGVIANNYLYNTSALKADNESAANFRKNTVIDLYNLQDGLYFGSFYIPSFNDDKLRTFTIKGNQLIALYQNHLVIYQFHL